MIPKGKQKLANYFAKKAAETCLRNILNVNILDGFKESRNSIIVIVCVFRDVSFSFSLRVVGGIWILIVSLPYHYTFAFTLFSNVFLK